MLSYRHNARRAQIEQFWPVAGAFVDKIYHLTCKYKWDSDVHSESDNGAAALQAGGSAVLREMTL